MGTTILGNNLALFCKVVCLEISKFSNPITRYITHSSSTKALGDRGILKIAMLAIAKKKQKNPNKPEKNPNKLKNIMLSKKEPKFQNIMYSRIFS